MTNFHATSVIFWPDHYYDINGYYRPECICGWRGHPNLHFTDATTQATTHLEEQPT